MSILIGVYIQTASTVDEGQDHQRVVLSTACEVWRTATEDQDFTKRSFTE